MGFELRPYQAAAIERCIQDLETHQRIGAVLPTGSGKTEIFVEICRRYTQANPTKQVLILSHLSLLTEQTAKRFELRAPEIKCSIMQGSQRPQWNASVVVSTMQTSRSKKHVEWLKDNTIKNVGLIIIDEAHFLPTQSYQTIMEHYPDAKIIGFTATPFREKKIMTSCFEKVSYSISLQELIHDGYLVPPTLKEIVSKGATTADVMATVIHLYKTHAFDRQAIVYMQTVEDARLLRTALETSGISAAAVTQELVGDYRTEILDRFNRGETRILSTVNVLTAGFDSPNVGAIFMPYGTSSPTTYLQRIGRGLRPARDKSDCLVFVFGDAPSISRKAYEHLTRKILHAGGPLVSHPTFKEDLIYNDYSNASEMYVWNNAVVEAVTKMEKLGMMKFASLLNEKRFPNRFMQNICGLLSALPARKSSLPHGERPATEAQKNVLFRGGFGSEVLSTLSKGEASQMVSAMFNLQNRSSSQQQYMVREGAHANKHVSELPHAYRTLVKKKFPDSPVAQLIIKWETERKKA